MLHLFSAVALSTAALAHGRDLSFALTKIDQTYSSMARCIDGSAPAYYWRAGTEEAVDKAVLFLEGGGWCFPSDVEQTVGANCAYRAKGSLGSSNGYGPTMTSMGYEGGNGFASGDASKTAWADWAFAYVKYCDGGSMTGTRDDPQPARNGSGPLYYRGHYNLEAQLDNMVATKNLSSYKEIILSGCSAGGMACYLKCDYVASYFSKYSIPVKCICDAGMFLDIETVTGAGNVMQARYHDIADTMQSQRGLPAACVEAESDWRQCMFSQYALKYAKTPTFVINSLYNFGAWAMLAPISQSSFPPDTSDVPSDWKDCWPANGKLSPQSFAKCNATQLDLIEHFREKFVEAIDVAVSQDTPHGAFADACPNQHCQTSTGWNRVKINGTTMAEAAARWYFQGTRERYIDQPFPANPSCGYSDDVAPICNNCANAGLGSNCLWDELRGEFHGLEAEALV